MDVKDAHILITGAASGMGAATARLLHTSGAKVSLLDRDEKTLYRIADEIGAMAFPCDVTDPILLQDAIQKANIEQTPARAYIHCAGVVSTRRMVNREGPMPLEEFRRMIEINLIGTFNLMRLAASALMPLSPLPDSLERGVIITTASIAAYEGQIGQTAYSASKGGVVSLTLPAARELAQFGIRVMTIAPGLVDTPLFDKISTTARKALEDSVPFPKRLARPSEYAALARHILENVMLNGEVIRLDGALRMQPK